MCFSGKHGFFNNLILNVYLKRLELIKIVMRARKGAMQATESSSQTPNMFHNMFKHVDSSQKTLDVQHN